MKKRLLSLGLSLSMLASLLAATTNIAYAADGKNEVSLKYYKTCTQETKNQHDSWKMSDEVKEVKVGDMFYAAVEVKNSDEMTGMTIAVKYDKDKVKLVNNVGDEIPLNTYTAKAADGMYMVGDVDVITTKKRQNNTWVDVDEEQFIIQILDGVNPTINTEKGLLYNISRLSTTPSEEVSGEFVILRFQALESGKAGIQIINDEKMAAESGYDGKPKDILVEIVTNKMGTLTPDNYVLYNDDIVINNPDSKQLAAPTNVKIDNRKVTWDAVDGAEKYEVSLTITNAEGAKDEKYVATSNSFDIPEEIKGCKVTAKVKAVSADSTVLASDYSDASNEVIYKTKLATPAPVWGDNKVTWKPIDGATKYNVIVTENGTEIYNGEVTETEKSVTFKSPDETTNAYKYIAKVTALGNEYAENSDEGVTEEKQILGSVRPARDLVWDGTSAKWTASLDAANVSGYEVVVMGTNGKPIGTETVTATSVDLAKYIADPGKYTFSVKAIGTNDYSSSKIVTVGDVKIVSVELEQVKNLQRSDRTITWDEVANSSGYEVTIYKDDKVVKDSFTIQSNSVNLDDYGFSGAGTFKVEVKALGDGTIYLSNKNPESITMTFNQRLDKPENVKWNVNSAEWDPVEHASAYSVEVYYNGVKIPKQPSQVEAVKNTYDLTDYIKYDGKYTFKVKAVGDDINYSSSEQAESDLKENVNSDKQGTVEFKLYKSFDPDNNVLSDVVTDTNKLRGGEDFYAAINVKGIKPVNGFSIPVHFDSDLVKVTDYSGNQAANKVYSADEVEELGFAYVGNAFKDFTLVSNEIYTEVDNDNGFVNVSMYYNGSPKSVSATDDETVLIIKFSAYKTGDCEIKFAAAGDARYDLASYAGLTMSSDGDEVFADITTAKTKIDKGRLPKMNAPVWNGEVITWNKVHGAVGYVLYIYKDGTQLGEAIDLTADKEAYSASDMIGNASGEYTARIIAKGDGVSADDSELSDASAAYIKRSGSGGTLGGGTLKPKPDDKPDVPDTKPELTDIDGHWAEESIRRLVDGGIIDGYDDNTFRPDLGITRAEFTKLIVTALGIELDESVNAYKDTENHWAKAYIAAGTEYGIVNGIGDDMFAPDRIITREQIAAIIYRIAGKPEVAESTFADRGEITDYAKQAVDYVAANGIMIGFDGNVFKGTESSTRAQIATVIDRLLQKNFFDGKLNIEKPAETTEKVEDAQASSTEENTSEDELESVNED